MDLCYAGPASKGGEAQVIEGNSSFNAGLARFGVGLVGMFMLPALYPPVAAHRWVFVLYLLSAAVFQLLIWKDIGGKARAIAGGLVDLTMITFLSHRVGSFNATVVSIYFIAVTLNSMAVGRKTGMLLAWLGALMYSGVVLAEAAELLPYAPDALGWAARGTPTILDGALEAGMVSLLLVSLAAVVGKLLRLVEKREEALLAANKRLERLSKLDPLTQLYNRRHLLHRLGEEMSWLSRGRPLAVLMIDLDKFKRVNDTHGHLTGDALLRELGDGLTEESRQTDVVGRYGGDEFLILLPDTDAGDAARVAKRMLVRVRDTSSRFDPPVEVTASIGMSMGAERESIQMIVQRADDAAIMSKQGGGDRISG